ncbi:Gx transporter family protein [Ruminococcus sp.]|uniref:Gx transporter family protein n=1 Tax=Ruminococcus sp. TaxID=41978 RepID=UPI0025F9FC77|nr:Gx transporter family protein [Ruminococcus sp.]MBQ8966645.1 Gx transporter family protein [Ruminococcus sp.]
MKVNKLTKLGLLTCLALIIFIVELRLPDVVPVPGVKLGLANIITVYCIYTFTPAETAMMLFSRILLGALFSGNLMALWYSIAGGALCFAGMVLLRRAADEKNMWFLSVIGAVLHNIGQITVAMIVLKSKAVLGYLPVLLISGCIAGLFTGICAQLVTGRLNSRRKNKSAEK